MVDISHRTAHITALIAAALLFSPPVAPEDAASRDAATETCESLDHFAFEWEAARPQTRIVPQVKESKRYPRSWSPSKRRGIHPTWTTFFNVHSKEAVPVMANALPPQEVFESLLRCRGFGTTHPIDPQLIATAVEVARHFESDRVEVISGYRSPKFNDALAKKGRNVAMESRHSTGQALDIRIVSAPAAAVAKWLYEHFDGGVGTYTQNNFVHIDTGPKRRWRGR